MSDDIIIVNDEFVRMYEDAVIVYFKILSVANAPVWLAPPYH
jgi:hypothetical protein